MYLPLETEVEESPRPVAEKTASSNKSPQQTEKRRKKNWRWIKKKRSTAP